MDGKIVAVFAEKGGVGRTTLSTNLASTLAGRDKAVLVVDMDPQATTSKFYLGPIETESLSKQNTVAALFDDRMEPAPSDIIRPTNREGVFLAPANNFLKQHNDSNPDSSGELQFCLRDFLRPVVESLDYVIIDTPPDLGNLPPWNSFLACDGLFVVFEPEPFGQQAIVEVDRALDAVFSRTQTSINFLGYVINKFDSRRALHKTLAEHLRTKKGDRVFETVMKDLGVYSDAQMLQMTVDEYAEKELRTKSKLKAATPALENLSNFADEIERRLYFGTAAKSVA